MSNASPWPRDAVLAAYTWTPGCCYRCMAATDTAIVGYLFKPSQIVPVTACEGCTLILERDRQAAATRYGWPYSPGTPCAQPRLARAAGENP